MKIGIFDSGLGGLFLMKHIVENLPQYDYIYLGDTKNLPYGDKSQEQIYRYTKSALDYLFKHDCAIVFILCNTASARALRRLQHENYRALGVIIPTVEEAHGNRIGILATKSTVDSQTYVLELKKLLPNSLVFQQSAPKLVPMIENGNIDEDIIAEYLAPLLEKNIDTLILGCTHYGILKGYIKKEIQSHINIICQEEIIGSKIKNYLKKHTEIEKTLSKNGKREFFVTKLTPEFENQAKSWFGESLQLQTYTVSKPQEFL